MKNQTSSEGEGDPRKQKKKTPTPASSAQKRQVRWALYMFLQTFLLSMLLSFLSSQAMEGAGYILAGLILLFFILLGIAFDIVGVAATSADEKPFHSMAARKVPGSVESLRLVRRADRVSSFCNDVVGDISGIISGTTTAVIVSNLSADFTLNKVVLQLVFSGIVAGLTVGGKAFGKFFAITYNTQILHVAGRIIQLIMLVPRMIFPQKDSE